MSKFSLSWARIGGVVLTLIVLVAAVLAGRYLWRYYQVDPWTRDGRVRGDVVRIAPDVSGLVTDVLVANDQAVKRGQVLFRIDPARFELALREAGAKVAAEKVSLAEARREAARNHRLGYLVARETVEQGDAKVAALQAALALAEAARDVAALNVQRASVVAPADGYLSDLTIFPGDYAVAGKPALAMIDAHSIRVEGYFEETKLKGVYIGERARIRLMGDRRQLSGHVVSIANGIEDRDRVLGASLLPNVNPTFSWVRLAQRVPVRVVLDRVPPDLHLILGRTATVVLIDDRHHKAAGGQAK